MLAVVRRWQAAEAIQGAISKAVDEYRSAIETERSFVAAHLQPGQHMPEIKTLTGSRREAFASRVDAFRDEALAELQALRDAIDDELTAPPSDEALRAVQALRMRENVSEGEISAFLRRYGDNYQIRSALEGGSYVGEVETVLAGIGQMEDSVTSALDAESILGGQRTVGSLSWSRMFVPETLGLVSGPLDMSDAADDEGDSETEAEDGE